MPEESKSMRKRKAIQRGEPAYPMPADTPSSAAVPQPTSRFFRGDGVEEFPVITAAEHGVGPAAPLPETSSGAQRVAHEIAEELCGGSEAAEEIILAKIAALAAPAHVESGDPATGAKE